MSGLGFSTRFKGVESSCFRPLNHCLENKKAVSSDRMDSFCLSVGEII